MKNWILPMALASLFAGVLGAALASVYVAPAPPPAPPLEREGPSASELQREIDDLRAVQAELLERLRMLEDAPHLAREETRAAIPPAPTSEAASMDAELEALVAAMKDPAAPVPENLRTTVGEALKSIRADEERARREQVVQAAAARLEERLQDLTLKLGLAPRQTNDLRDLFTAQALKRDELWRTARDSGDFLSPRDAMREMRDEIDAGLASILTPVQLEEFQKLDVQDRRMDLGLGPFRRGVRGGGD